MLQVTKSLREYFARPVPEEKRFFAQPGSIGDADIKASHSARPK
ncbi:hypothetical protein [Mesorhizobium sp.]|nr:hypothetical protein [Mesorhizobium sp.]